MYDTVQSFQRSKAKMKKNATASTDTLPELRASR